jgi:hypothetical protein
MLPLRKLGPGIVIAATGLGAGDLSQLDSGALE